MHSRTVCWEERSDHLLKLIQQRGYQFAWPTPARRCGAFCLVKEEDAKAKIIGRWKGIAKETTSAALSSETDRKTGHINIPRCPEIDQHWDISLHTDKTVRACSAGLLATQAIALLCMGRSWSACLSP